jgi:hypothetical protein
MYISRQSLAGIQVKLHDALRESFSTVVNRRLHQLFDVESFFYSLDAARRRRSCTASHSGAVGGGG